MPLTTEIPTNPPNVDVKVKDGGPGGGRPRIVDLHMSWDSSVLDYRGSRPRGDYCNKNGTGTLHWHRRRCPASGGHFIVNLRCKKTKRAVKTYITACAMDPKKGDLAPRKKLVRCM